MDKSSRKRSSGLLKFAWLCLLLTLAGAYAGLEWNTPLMDSEAILLALPGAEAVTSHQEIHSSIQENALSNDVTSSGIERLESTPLDQHQTTSDKISTLPIETPHAKEEPNSKLSWPEERADNKPTATNDHDFTNQSSSPSSEATREE